MIKLQQIAQEALPLDKFGQYLRDHIIDRGKEYARQEVMMAIKHFAKGVSEQEVHQFINERFEAQQSVWENQTLPIIMGDLKASAQYYVDQHRKLYGPPPGEDVDKPAEDAAPWESCTHEYVYDTDEQTKEEIQICVHCGHVKS